MAAWAVRGQMRKRPSECDISDDGVDWEGETRQIACYALVNRADGFRTVLRLRALATPVATDSQQQDRRVRILTRKKAPETKSGQVPCG
jgi:hypothetical protein